MQIKNETVWIIMSTDRKLIAKGTPRNRALIEVDNIKDKKRILTYASRGKAESAFKISGFSTWNLPDEIRKNGSTEKLEAVECNLTLTAILS